MKVIRFCLLLTVVYTSLISSAQRLELPDYHPVPVLQLQAEALASYPAVEAGQGAAADADYFYAIVNTGIGKYSKASGALVDRWMGPRSGPVRHLNSCYVEDGLLYCSNSNFPEVPMASSIEVFDTSNMEHVRSFSLGVLEEGSLTWFDRLNDGWIAGFAHYDADGGLNYKDHSFASIIRYDDQWRRIGGWMIPESAISRMQPYAASGGELGDDGLLYLTGHDRPEMYVLAAPKMGPKLVHIATIEINIEGQAFSWDRSSPDRVIYGISRPNREVRAFRLPEVALPQGLSSLTGVRAGF
ncbi:MAG: hypothetical protein RL839_07295 [Gammaproteobacteria bacterium]